MKTKTQPTKTTSKTSKASPNVGASSSQEQGEKQRPPQLFKPGQSGNPGGRPVGSRNKLQGDFMRELADDFSEHGRTAIQNCRTEKPDVYIKVVASLMPKELEIKRPLEELSDDELDNAVALLRERLGAAAGSRKGSGAAKVGESTGAVRTLQ